VSVTQGGGSRVEPGSFRDPDSRVFLTAEGVHRALSERGLADYEALAASRLFARGQDEGTIVRTERSELEAPPDLLPGGVAAVLEHERVPFVSYPYEWTFGMLRDAALLHLDLLDAALGESLTLKDATPYNVQWQGARPVFADLGSFEVLRPSEPWIGYRQFCTLFLYPLMLQAYRGVPFQPWLRGSLEGISPAEAAGLLSLRDRLRRGVLIHVALHARLERRNAGRTGREVKRDLQKAGFRPEIVQANVRRMRKLVAKLRWEPPHTAWTDYDEANRGYAQADLEDKQRFVVAAAQRARPRVAWDLGANDGAFSRLVADHAGHVVAMDSDHATVERLYRRLAADGERRILPLVIDLGDPSPARGWALAERRPLDDRGRPELTLSLALVHHLSITGNVPVREVVAWLAALGSTHVIEFPRREDPMVKRLLAAKRDDDAHPDYELGHFEACLQERFHVHERAELGSRVLFEATVREP
jgi:hypothetical protein